MLLRHFEELQPLKMLRLVPFLLSLIRWEGDPKSGDDGKLSHSYLGFPYK